jgi:hypothetical protein
MARAAILTDGIQWIEVINVNPESVAAVRQQLAKFVDVGVSTCVSRPHPCATA